MDSMHDVFEGLDPFSVMLCFHLWSIKNGLIMGRMTIKISQYNSRRKDKKDGQLHQTERKPAMVPT
jgi:hypothetical protein